MKKKTHEEFIQELYEKNPNITVLGEYINANVGVHCQCKICGFNKYKNDKPWTPQPSSLLQGFGCPACAATKSSQKKAKPHKIFCEEMATKQPTIEVLGQYVNAHTGVHCRCKICGFDHYDDGRTWLPKPSGLLSGQGCPRCALEHQTSFPEQAILYYCKQATEAKSRCIKFGKEIDVFLPMYNIGIEYNGRFFHQYKKDYDNNKIKSLFEHGIRIITIQDGDKNDVSKDVITHDSHSLDWALKQVFIIIGLYIDIDTKKDRSKIYQQYLVQRKENSFALKYPDKADEWDYEKNGSITPEMVSCKSNKSFYRICPNCKNSYLIPIQNWTLYSVCHKCYLKGMKNKNTRSKSVLLLDIENNIVKRCSSQTEMSKFLCISRDAVARRCKSGKRFTSGKYINHLLVNDSNIEIQGVCI